MRTPVIIAALGLAAKVFGSSDTGAKFHLAAEGLFASDVQVSDTTAGALWSGPGREAAVTLGWSRLAVDYSPAPADLITRAAARTETRRAAQFDARRDFGGRWTALAGGGLYRGFGDHRSMWIDEYDRQLFAGAPGYAPAAPHGWHAAAGARWAWRPGSTFFQAMLTRRADTVAPGYEPRIGQPLLRGRERLHTSSANLSFEHIATPLVRLRLDGSAADTTGRARRHTIIGSANWTPAEQWVLRATAGATREAPTLRAAWLQLALDRDWANRWFAGLLVRGYRDRGEVLDPLVPSSAAPALHTLHAAASLRWQGARHAWRLEAGPYRTAYAPVPPAAWQFARLYRDRTWLRVQAAFHGEF
ncbi:MAG: hypothetical protein HY736_08845 [Verrucomicrobia bacterium]|nr:hypothetical protein [Verrucomicrobiota bacterium]